MSRYSDVTEDMEVKNSQYLQDELDNMELGNEYLKSAIILFSSGRAWMIRRTLEAQVDLANDRINELKRRIADFDTVAAQQKHAGEYDATREYERAVK